MNTLNFDIYEDNLTKFQKDVEKFNRKCVKFGLPEVVVVYGEKFIEKHRDGNSDKFYFYPKQSVIVNYPEIKLNDNYIVIGKIEHYFGSEKDGDKRNINIVSAFGERDLCVYSFVKNRCDHCNSVRQRNVMYVVKNVITNEEKVIGSSCLKDFVGHNVEGALLMSGIKDFFKIHGEQDPDNVGFDKRTGVGFELLIDMTIGCIIADKGRYYSKKNAIENDYCTVGAVEKHYFEMCAGLETTYTYLEEEVKIFTQNILNEIEEKAEEGNLDTFTQNIVTFKKIDMVEVKFFSMVVGYVGFWWISNNKFESSTSLPSEFIGVEGVKIELDVVVDRVIESSGQYGGVLIFGHQNGTGNKFAWYTTTANELYEWKDGMPRKIEGVFKIKATVKNHKDDEKFGKSTWITRAKVL